MGQCTQRTENRAWHIITLNKVSVISSGFGRRQILNTLDGQGVEMELWAGLREQTRSVVASTDWPRWEVVISLVWKGKGSSSVTRIQWKLRL